jgi:hypothetical protein
MKYKLLLLTLVSFNAVAQTNFIYSADGRYIGSATASVNGHTVYYADAVGQPVGSVMASAVPITVPIPMYVPPQVYTPAFTTPVQSLTPMFDAVFGK